MTTPRALDFAEIADGVVRNNMGVGRIDVRLRATTNADRVTILPTKQTFPLRGSAPSTPPVDGDWHEFRVDSPSEPARTTFSWL
ncbi:MAG: hypothetical protein AB7I19_12470 [Planctomycetota bacterium]